jgi:SAM-dependent methyltransferase
VLGGRLAHVRSAGRAVEAREVTQARPVGAVCRDVMGVALRCPDCAKSVGELTGSPACPGCGRVFAADAGVWNLLPRDLDAASAAEDRLHEDEGEPTWRRLFFHKRYWLEWCATRWLPAIVHDGTRRFLEIGGGLCYASALAKARRPSAAVVATDVSPRYLRRHAVRVGAMLDAPADVYAAVDALALPFEDGEFDAVYSQVVLYRLADPARALREIARVLAPGGRYLGIERASPSAPPFRAREAAAMDRRVRAQGIRERALTYADWQAIAVRAGLGAAAIAPVPGGRVRAAWLRRLGNVARPIYVAIRVRR